MGDHRVDLDLALHIPIDDLWHIGTATRATKCSAAPAAAGHQLERPGRDFGTRRGHADDDAFAPTFVRGFQCGAHYADISSRIECVIGPALGQGDQMRDQIARHFRRVHEIGHAETGGHIKLAVVQVHANDLISPGKPQALDHVQPDPAQTKDNRAAADLDLGGVDDSADARGDTAANIADLVERRILADLGQRDFRQNGVIGKGRTAHVMQNRRAIEHRKPAGPIRHDTRPLGAADFLAQVGFGVQAIFAFAAFGRV